MWQKLQGDELLLNFLFLNFVLLKKGLINFVLNQLWIKEMKYFLLCFLLLFASQVFAQYQNVMINNPSSTDPEEVSIAIDPSNPNYLAAGANIDYSYYSTNGGLNWTQHTISSSLGVWGDPCPVYDESGYLYYIHLSWATNWIDRIVCQRSTDHGVTFNDGAGIGLNTPPKAQDKAWLRG